MLIVGITGGIASGKSTVDRMLEEEGAYIIDTDLISRAVVEPGKPGWQEVIHLFRKEVLNDDQTLNRKKLGDIVFSDAEKRKALEKILHPKINQEKLRKMRAIEKTDPHAIVILDIPLLIELNGQDTVDKVVLVYVSPRTQLERLMKRDSLSVDDAQKRIQSQMALEAKKQYAHYIINNEGSPEKTKQEVREVFQDLKEYEKQKQLRKGREV